MTEKYHRLPQSMRIQKRLALNQCFKEIRPNIDSAPAITYVTFGGSDLYDVMDLLAVCSLRSHRFQVVSFEVDREIAAQARICPVARTLARVETVSVEIFPAEFPSGLERHIGARANTPFIYFLDYTKTFADGERLAVGSLLSDGLLRAGDYLLVTSCLTPRVVHQRGFMDSYRTAFSLFFGAAADRDFKVRNHVDLLLGITSSEFERTAAASGRDGVAASLWFRLLRKFKYSDSRAPMGLWLYEVASSERRLTSISDSRFEEFPHAFVAAAPKKRSVVNIFD